MKLLRHLSRNQSGVALLPMLIVAAASSLAFAYWIMSEQELSSRVNVRSLATEAVDSASVIIKTSLASSDFCTHNIAGKPINGTTLTELRRPDGSLLATANPTTGTMYNHTQDVRLIKLTLDTWKNPATGNISDYLFVVYNTDPHDRKNVIGGETFGKKFRLRGKKDGSGNYIFCYHEESNFVELSAKKNCEDMLGVWNDWICTIDPNTYNAGNSITCATGNLYYTIVGGKLTLTCGP